MKIFVALVAVLSLGIAILSPAAVQASREQDLSLCIAEGGTVSGSGANVTCTRPSDARTVEGTIPTIMQIAFFILGVLAVIMIVYGGIQFITSRGGEEVKKAKATIIWAVAGLVVAILAYAITRWAFDSLHN